MIYKYYSFDNLWRNSKPTKSFWDSNISVIFSHCKGWQYFIRQKIALWIDLHIQYCMDILS